MSDPLFRQPTEALSPEEEAEITRKLAEAYRQHEEGEKRPEFQRIAKSIQEKLSENMSAATESSSGRASELG